MSFEHKLHHSVLSVLIVASTEITDNNDSVNLFITTLPFFISQFLLNIYKHSTQNTVSTEYSVFKSSRKCLAYAIIG